MIRQPYIVRRGALVPADDEGRAQLEHMEGEEIEVAIYRARPRKFDSLLYATLRLLGNAMHWREDKTRGWLAIKAGHADVAQWPPPPHTVPGTARLMIPRSTSPGTLGRAQLEAFWDDVRPVIVADVLPYVDLDAAEQIRFRIAELS